MSVHPLRDELAALRRIAAPAILTQIFQMALGTIDTLMAGQLGPDALAAVATGSNLIAPLMLFLLGVFLALNPLCAQANGASDPRAIARHVQGGLWLAILLALPAFLLWRETTVVLDWLGTDPATRPMAGDYVHALSWGTPFLWGYMALRATNEGLFANRAAMTVAFLAMPLNVLFNWIFMYGKFGVPALGAVGTGYATACVWACCFFMLLIYTLRAKRHHAFVRELKLRKPEAHELRDIVHIGTPMGAAFAMEVLMFAMMGLMMARYNTTTIAAHQIALNFASLTFMIPLGMGNAITARVGFNAGAGSASGVRRAGWAGISAAALISTLSITAMLFFPEQITGVYTQDANVTAVAIGFLFLAAFYQLSDALQVTAVGALRGLKDTRYPMIISFIAYWIVGFPSGWAMATWTSMGPSGYWAGMIAGLSMAAVLLNWRFHVLSRRWRAP